MGKAAALGPLSTKAALAQLLDQIKRAVAKGATLVMGGKRVASQNLVCVASINAPA